MTVDLDFARFESIGDNCEFGFVLRSFGNLESSLFRWAFLADYAKLLDFVPNVPIDLYHSDLLVPFVDDMVTNVKYEISFHSKLLSKCIGGNRVYLYKEYDFTKIHKNEVEKISYLSSKFENSLRSGRKIFVIKNNLNEMAREIDVLASRIFKCSGSKTLRIVRTDDFFAFGKVVKESNHLYLGFIDEFAYYESADLIRSKYWPEILINALKIM